MRIATVSKWLQGRWWSNSARSYYWSIWKGSKWISRRCSTRSWVTVYHTQVCSILKITRYIMGHKISKLVNKRRTRIIKRITFKISTFPIMSCCRITVIWVPRRSFKSMKIITMIAGSNLLLKGLNHKLTEINNWLTIATIWKVLLSIMAQGWIMATTGLFQDLLDRIRNGLNTMTKR